MRIHKMDADEIAVVREFVSACELMLERERFSMQEPYNKWKDWPEDDDDRRQISDIRKSIAKEEGVSEKDVDSRIVAYEYLQRRYTHRLQLAIMTAEVLIENCCDPTLSYLEFHPYMEDIHVAAEQ